MLIIKVLITLFCHWSASCSLTFLASSSSEIFAVYSASSAAYRDKMYINELKVMLHQIKTSETP